MRGRGLGPAFFARVIEDLGSEAANYNLWVHGSATDTGIESPANELAEAAGFTPVRVLYKMVLPLDEQTRENLAELSDARTLPDSLELRTFTPADENPWLRVNAEAFAEHPEQGRLTLADLRERTGSDWFRPEGSFSSLSGKTRIILRRLRGQKFLPLRPSRGSRSMIWCLRVRFMWWGSAQTPRVAVWGAP